MEPQETMDWEFTINNLIDRIQALENQNRSHAQRTADIQGAINMVDAKVTTAVTDVDEYKTFVTSKFEHVGRATETTFNDTDAESTTSNPIRRSLNITLWWQAAGWTQWTCR